MARIDDLKGLLREKNSLLNSLKESHLLGPLSATPDILLKIKEAEQEQERLSQDLEIIEDNDKLSNSPVEEIPSVFISYSHKDEAEKEELLTHLRVLERAGVFKLWIDDHIEGGGDWRSEIHQAIDDAEIVILLISNNFLLSEFIADNEVPAFLERRESEEITVFPIIAKYSGWWAFDWLNRMNVRPKNGLPIWRGADAQVDKELHDISREIAMLARKRRLAGIKHSRSRKK